MIRAQSLPTREAGQRPNVRALMAVGLFGYFVVLADLTWRDGGTLLALLNAVLGAALVVIFVLRAPRNADRIDRTLLIALLVFMSACVVSAFPRQSFDSGLAALLYLSGYFALRGVLSRQHERRLFAVGLMGLSGLLTIVVAIQMLVPYFEWWALTGWSVTPPLDLRIRPEPWILHYELALLLVLLYPSWWIGHPSRRRVIAGVVVGLLVIAVCTIAGSRAVWAAAAAGGAAVAPPVARWMIQRIGWRAPVIVATFLLLASVVLTPGLWGSLGERAGRTASIFERASVWRPALDAWADRPIAGLGPGSFPWVLQGTGYFDTHAFAPRHPDSALVQLVVETGLIGVIAAAIVIATVLPAVIRGRSRGALFAVAAWLVAGIALNTAESEMLIAVMIGWVALATPRDARVTRPVAAARRSWRRPLLATALVIAGLAFSATTIATLAYSVGRTAAERGDLGSAVGALELATTLDPGLAIYPRQLGTARLLQGSPGAAIVVLERSAKVNPNDDLTWRILALAYAEAGETAPSRRALEHAIQLQRSDATNLLLMARSLTNSEDGDAARDLFAEIAQSWPAIVAAPGWSALARPFSTEEIAALALHRWAAELPSPEPRAYQPLLLEVLGGPGAVDARFDQRLTTLQTAYVAVMRCDPSSDLALSAATASDRRQPTYWELAVRQAVLTDDSRQRDYERLHEIMTHSRILADPEMASRRLNPLHENGHRESSADTWGYRRWPIAWPDTEWDLPSPAAGFAAWHRKPEQAIERAGIAGDLPNCVSRAGADSRAQP